MGLSRNSRGLRTMRFPRKRRGLRTMPRHCWGLRPRPRHCWGLGPMGPLRRGPPKGRRRRTNGSSIQRLQISIRGRRSQGLFHCIHQPRLGIVVVGFGNWTALTRDSQNAGRRDRSRCCIADVRSWIGSQMSIRTWLTGVTDETRPIQGRWFHACRGRARGRSARSRLWLRPLALLTGHLHP